MFRHSFLLFSSLSLPLSLSLFFLPRFAARLFPSIYVLHLVFSSRPFLFLFLFLSLFCSLLLRFLLILLILLSSLSPLCPSSSSTPSSPHPSLISSHHLSSFPTTLMENGGLPRVAIQACLRGWQTPTHIHKKTPDQWSMSVLEVHKGCIPLALSKHTLGTTTGA